MLFVSINTYSSKWIGIVSEIHYYLCLLNFLDETESESEDETEEDSSSAKLNGYTNGVKTSKGYELDDFQLLKTIGKF